MIPAVYAYYHNTHFLGVVLTATSVLSANYWRRATFSWRRHADMVMAKVAFVIFVWNGAQHIRRVPHMMAGYPCIGLLAASYYMSEKHLRKKDLYWWVYHFLFHIVLTIEQFIVVDGVVRR